MKLSGTCHRVSLWERRQYRPSGTIRPIIGHASSGISWFPKRDIFQNYLFAQHKRNMSVYTREEVAKHNKPEDLWIIIDNVVLDLTKFVQFHPGGATVLHEVAGQDATEEFYSLHRQEVLIKYLNKYKIGTIAHETAKIEIRQPGAISKVPYAEPSYWMGLHSPYFNDSHRRFRDAVRKFYDENVIPEAAASEESGKVPSSELFQKMGAFGIWVSRVGPGPWIKMAVESGLCTLPGGVNPDEFDYFHELIAHEESIRIGYPSFADSLGAGLVIGLPPVLNFGSDELRSRVVPEVLSGKKRICLAISEPTAGSDVANIKTTATKTPDGKFFIVNGVKKWITNGTFCDYFSTAVKTENGISMLLIERSEGLDTESIKTSYSSSAGTAYITFQNVKVPVENLLGKEGKGFKVIMFNFNHERWTINCAAIRASRFIVEECFKWASQRKVFGKPLLSQPVIRNKLARMVAQLESVQNWHENITYQMCKMSYLDQSKHLAGPIALCKYQATRVAYNISDDACQIFGGRAITRTGMGRVIESFQRTIKYGAILGGSEEIMADLGIRQAIKDMPNAKL